MKVVLFGAGGQVGSSLLELFRDDFDWVCPQKQQFGGDLLYPEAVYRYLLCEQPEAIVNAAAFTAVDKAPRYLYEAQTVNAEAPALMAQAASELGAYFVHLSTDYVFNGNGEKAWKESDQKNPVNAYGKTKAEGEDLVLKHDSQALILRLSWLHAPGHLNFVSSFCKRLQEQSEVSVVTDQWGSPTSARDVAEVINLLLSKDKNGTPFHGIYHFANQGFCSRYECAQYILRVLKEAGISWASNKNIVRAKTADYLSSEPRPLNCRLDTQKLCSQLSIAPRPWQEALGATLKHYCQEI